MKTKGKIKFGRPSTLPVHVEKEIHDHVAQLETALYGLTPRELRRLAFDIVTASSAKDPFNKTSKLAGEDWSDGFMKRLPDLSVRLLQGTNLSRAVSFNKSNVQFFAIYKKLLEEHDYAPSRIWNMDETGITSVH